MYHNLLAMTSGVTPFPSVIVEVIAEVDADHSGVSIILYNVIDSYSFKWPCTAGVLFEVLSKVLCTSASLRDARGLHLHGVMIGSVLTFRGFQKAFECRKASRQAAQRQTSGVQFGRRPPQGDAGHTNKIETPI